VGYSVQGAQERSSVVAHLAARTNTREKHQRNPEIAVENKMRRIRQNTHALAGFAAG